MPGWALAELANDVGGLVTQLVMRSHLQLREQTEREELDTAHHEQNAKEQERPVGDIVAASVAASTAEAERASGREDEEGLM